MNERIKKLAEQAGLYVDLNGQPWPKSMSAEECELAYKKFAELIVRECAQVAKLTEEDDGDDYKSGRVWAGIEVLKHFGVEE